ncbi:hypothetical protein EN978_32095 [Mesorhizobium sp. M7A.F.Ca.US.001.04.1.1]|uniref:hypothetical protein n=1 Tax=unclassified Mesorhizobium TaxID=325217 RepID=UPI000FCAEFE0|nr:MULTISPECIES: hypothetical protein [unclassified Mesorhizobium]RUY21802.1 hypothetical protein EN979_33590 [Mesorhizobium sp. M7A.F.Ca.US.001.04.2.1]RUY35495.1 hypothetical protein EN978_32095 [Mesorhizobium sp. M7A.F.Ca.US.001.04.1.1]
MGFFANRVVLARWTSAMLVISALLFAAAVLMEGSGHRESASMAAHDEAAEAQEQGGRDQAAESSTPKQGGNSAEIGETGDHAEQTILGINLETPWLVWGFVGVSIMLAAAVLKLGKATLLLAILLAGAAAILDGREVFLQLARANTSVASLAALTALAHAAVVILAIFAWQATSTLAGPATGRNTQ